MIDFDIIINVIGKFYIILTIL